MPASAARISGRRLRTAYLDDAMVGYFTRKLPDVAEAELLIRLEELLKFLFISRECRGPIPVTREIDDVWHWWILQTVQYEELCARLPDHRFIHHSSYDYVVPGEASLDPVDQLENDVRMLALYVENFGPMQPDRVRHWTFASRLIEHDGWTLDELNDWLADR